jgi:hypothetical protein
VIYINGVVFLIVINVVIKELQQNYFVRIPLGMEIL